MLGSMYNANCFRVLNVHFYHNILKNQETAACLKSSAAAPAAGAPGRGMAGPGPGLHSSASLSPSEY